MMRETDVARFERKVDRSAGPDGCHPWLAARDRDGYGQFHLEGRQQKAHRVAWEIKHGSLVPELVPDHLCRHPWCVNVRHLEPVTVAENILRGDSPSARAGRQQACISGHPFDGSRGDGRWRKCKTCARAATSKWRAARSGVAGVQPATTSPAAEGATADATEA